MPPTTIISGLMVGRLFSSKKVYFVVSMLIWGMGRVFTCFYNIYGNPQKDTKAKSYEDTVN